MKIFDPIYQEEIEPTKSEQSVITSRSFQRLKHIRHAGAYYDRSPHTRYEHSLGTYILGKKLELDDITRMALLCHDLGHMPFSHSMEKAFCDTQNHKFLTENIIKDGEIFEILRKNRFDIDKILFLIGKKEKHNPVCPTGDVLSIDHLDSFIRDVFYFGKNTENIPFLINDIIIEDGIVQAKTLETGMKIMNILFEDHKILFSKKALYIEFLAKNLFMIAKEKKILCDEDVKLADFDVLAKLFRSEDPTISHLTHKVFSFVPLMEDHEIPVQKSEDTPNYFVKRIYDESVYFQGQPIENFSEEIKSKLKKLQEIKGGYSIS